jgi:hypothetical protein
MNQVRIERLRTYMKDLPAGQIAAGLKRNVEQLLFESWNELKIRPDDLRVEPYNLVNRTGTLIWQPPLLTFRIESYEAAVDGSIDAKVREWKVNLETAEALLGRVVAERDYSLIAEESQAVPRNMRANGRMFGRPKRVPGVKQIVSLKGDSK